MKTIEVPDEMYKQLMELSKEINTQDNRATAKPYFFQIQTKERVYVPDGCGVEIWVRDDSTLETEEEINEALLGCDQQFDDEFIKNMKNWKKEEALERAGWRKVCYSEEYRCQNAFLTEKSCKEHIKSNSYHYSQPTDYLSHAFRNPDLEIIFKFLSELTNKK